MFEQLTCRAAAFERDGETENGESKQEDRGHVYVRPKIYWNTVIYQTSRTVDLGPDVDVPAVFLLGLSILRTIPPGRQRMESPRWNTRWNTVISELICGQNHRLGE